MAIWSGLGNVGSAVVATAAATVVVVGGVMAMHMLDRAVSDDTQGPASTDLAAVTSTSDPETVPEVVPETMPSQNEVSVSVQPGPRATVIDLFRADAGGNIVVAGSAEPNAEIVIFVDGVEATRAPSDGQGAFAALFTVPLADRPRVVTLAMELPGQAALKSSVSAIIEPRVVQVAEPNIDTTAPADTVLASETAVTDAPDEVADPAPEIELATRPDTSQPDASIPSGEPAEKPEVIAALDAEPETVIPSTTATAPEATSDPTIVTNVPADTVSEPANDLAPDPETEPAAIETFVELAETTVEDAIGVSQTPEQPAQADIELASLETAPIVSSAEPSLTSPTLATSGSQPPLAKVDTVPAKPGAGLSEPSTPSVLLADDTGIRVVQSGGAATPGVQSVVIDTISYDPQGEVSLGGRGAGAGFVRVYLNNKPIKTTEIGIDGQWRTPLPEFDTGVYTLRIDEVDDAGNVTSRVETPFKREEPEVVAALDTRNEAERVDLGVITVQPGHTLWGIASEKYGDGLLYVRVFDANKDRIRNPDLIYPGQVFSVPGE